MDVKLSIIVPFHKGIHFLEDCLESIRDQGLTNYETILVLDHTKEDVSELINTYQDLKLKVIELRETQLTNRKFGKPGTEEQLKYFSGVACARNKGLEAATGEYVYFLDSDDYILSGTLQLLLQEAEEQQADFTYGKKTSTWFSRKAYLASITEVEQEEEADDQDPNDQEQSDQEMSDQEVQGTQEENDTPVKLTRRQRKILKVQQRLAAVSEVDDEVLARIAEAYHTLFVTRKGLRNVSVLGVLFRRSFLIDNDICFNEQYIFFSDCTLMVQALKNAKMCSYIPEAIYIKRKHNDPIHYPALSQLKTEDKFEEYLQAYQQARSYTEEETPLRSYTEDKLIAYYTSTYAPRLRRSEKEIWRTERFQAMRAAMQEVDQDKLRNLKGYKKRIVKALLKNNVRGATRVVTRHLGIKKFRKMKKNKKVFAYYLYNKVFKKLAIKENWIIFETFFGKSYSDSPKYIYEYLLKNAPGKYRIIWSCTSRKTEIPGSHTKVKRNSLRYCYYMARSKYFVFNVRQPEWFTKREGMVFLETWHGTPLKRLVFDQEEVMAASPLYKAQFYRHSQQWDYLVAANLFSSETFRSAFLFHNEMLEFGYPRNDILHSSERDRIAAELRRKLKIPENKKTILYAPTWRDDEYYGHGAYKFALKLDLRMLREQLGPDYIVLLRTHYFIADSIDVTGIEDFAVNVSKYNDISELYLISDILITDYSSVFFDYANLKRPILFYTYDLDKYRDMLRGFYMDIEKEVPGPLLFTTEEVADAIKNIKDITADYSKRYEDFYERFCSLEDGHASENIVKRVFGV